MKKILLLLIVLLLEPLSASAITVSDYLIDADIGQFSKSYPGACPKGSGVVASAGHFKIDHTDYACDIRYYNESANLGIEVQVTKHAGSDSDKWLLHELDKGFRTSLGIPGEEYEMRVIDGNTIMAFGSAGWTYRWLSGTKVLQIQYRDSQMTKSEPLEIVRTYLTKHPSALVAMTSADLRTATNKITWIKDEMDRRLWLCDKWFYQLQTGKVEQQKVLQESIKSMNIFLDYREKYYGVKAADEKNMLAGYLNNNNGTDIRAKLTEYKNWWSIHKTDTISL
jgi:hypothetical protein